MMISDIVWIVVLFLIPGMAAFTVYRYIAGYAIDKLYKFIFYSAMWALLSYGITECFMSWFYGIPIGKNLSIWIMFRYKFADVSLGEMVWTLGVGISAGWGGGWAMRRIRLNWPGLLHVKLWDYYVNSLCKEERKVEVYDYKNNCRYVGYIKAFSCFSSRKEIVLKEPEIYSLQGKLLTEKQEKTGEIYLQLEDNRFVIVVPGPEGKARKGENGLAGKAGVRKPDAVRQYAGCTEE